MSQIKEIKNRIKSIKDVQQITKAMKMVAAAKLRKIEAKYEYAKMHLNEVENILAFILKRNSWVKHDLLRENDVPEKGLLVFSGDKGLCGGFNLNIVKKVLSEFSKTGKNQTKIFGVGKKANISLKKESLEFLMDMRGIFGKVKYSDALSISNEVMESFLSKKVGTVNIVLNRFKSQSEESVESVTLLPLEIPDSEASEADFLYDCGVEATVASLLPHYFSLKIYKYLLESETAEFLARMTAMDAASENANDLIAKLTLEYNRARQATITKEILDIVGGAEALA